MSYELHWFPGTCARVPFVALEEIGEPFSVTVVNRMAGVSPEFLSVNPKGKVPVLVTPSRVITENPAIATYLHRRHPEAALLPQGDSDADIDALETMSWFAAGIHRYITPLRFPRFFSSMTEAHDDIRAIARRDLEGSFTIIEERLADREWLFGEWSIVDAYLLWLWFRATGSGMDGSAFPRCDAHAQRCETRPSVAKVIAREESELERMVAAGQIQGRFPDYQAGRAPTYGVSRATD